MRVRVVGEWGDTYEGDLIMGTHPLTNDTLNTVLMDRHLRTPNGRALFIYPEDQIEEVVENGQPALFAL